LDELSLRAAAAAKGLCRDRRAIVGSLAGRLESLSPLAVLERGYSVTTDESGRILRDAAELNRGQTIITRLSKGSAASKVEAVEK
jgi:exodeoxyribonuclease VII large subunit